MTSIFEEIFGPLTSESTNSRKSITITKLDNGFLLTSSGKQSAYTDLSGVFDAIKKIWNDQR